ncbi:MAG: energy transducer TonB [Bacteroidetes bacterium]|nr:energy transducer TonB [Bacteroidota bacterium]
MKYFLILLLFSLAINLYSQSTLEVYLDGNSGLAVNPNSAKIKVVIANQSKKKFDLTRHQKSNDGWQKSSISIKVTRKKDNRYKLQHCLNEQVVRTSEREIIDTTDVGFVIKEYEDGFCVRKAEVSSVFPLVHNGFCFLYDKRKPDDELVELYTNNLRYETVTEGINKNYQSIRPAMYPKGKHKFISDILDNISIPDELETDSLNDTLMMSFTVDTMGQIVNSAVKQSFNKEISDQVEYLLSESTRPWIPASLDGKRVPISYLIPLIIKAKPKVYFMIDQMPEYPGGDLQLRKDIASSVRYPIEAQVKGIQGKVYVSFIVDTKGIIRNTKVARGVSSVLDNEALRVINNLKDWTPGEQKGEKVCVSYTVPINFVLQKGKPVNRTGSSIHHQRGLYGNSIIRR